MFLCLVETAGFHEFTSTYSKSHSWYMHLPTTYGGITTPPSTLNLPSNESVMRVRHVGQITGIEAALGDAPFRVRRVLTRFPLKIKGRVFISLSSILHRRLAQVSYVALYRA